MRPLTLVALLLMQVTSAAESLHLTFSKTTDAALLEFIREHPYLVTEKDDSQCTALHYAARYGKVKTAEWLLQNKADVNTVSYNDFTPMHVVSDEVTARVLIAAGANLNAIDVWGKTPLQRAAEGNKKNVAQAILDSGYPIDLASALWLGKEDDAIKIIKNNPAAARRVINQSDLWSNTSPLGIAASQHNIEIVRLLLAIGAPVNATTDRPGAGPMSALSNAVLAGDYEIVKLLCEAGADCNVSAGKYYPRLLDYAREHSDAKMVEVLIKHGGQGSVKER